MRRGMILVINQLWFGFGFWPGCVLSFFLRLLVGWFGDERLTSYWNLDSLDGMVYLNTINSLVDIYVAR